VSKFFERATASQYSVKFDEAKRHAVYHRDGYSCHYCHKKDETGKGVGLSLDHIKARSQGGDAQNTKSSPADNLITACHACNFAKQDKSPRQWNVYLASRGDGLKVDWSAVRRQASKEIDIKKGEELSQEARKYRDERDKAKVAPSKEESKPAEEKKPEDKPADKPKKTEEKGPGIHHGKDGKFQPGHAGSSSFRARLATAFAERGILALGEIKAPLRFRIWHSGNNPGDPGDNHVTPAACARLQSAYERRGAALAIDFDHATNEQKQPDPLRRGKEPLAGYAEMQVKNGEVWLDPIRWSDCGRLYAVPGVLCCGKHAIETGQRGYVSPDWILDPDTREPIEILRIGLVREPGTYGIPMLAERAQASRSNTVDDIAILKALLAAASAASAAQDPDLQQLGQTVGSACTDLAQAKGMDLSAAPASSPAPSAPPAAAAAAPAADPEKQAAASAIAARLRSMPSRPVGLTAADVEQVVTSRMAEERERAEILTSNKDVLAGFETLLTGKPLAEVKSFVATACAARDKRIAQETAAAAPRGAEIPAPGAPQATGSKQLSVVSYWRDKTKTA